MVAGHSLETMGGEYLRDSFRGISQLAESAVRLGLGIELTSEHYLDNGALVKRYRLRTYEVDRAATREELANIALQKAKQ